MKIREILTSIISEVKKTRLDILMATLKQFNIPYTIQADSLATNVIVSFRVNASDNITVLGAHYDVYTGSLGINDNTCAVAMLIKLAEAFVQSPPNRNIDIVFFDREESGMHGSRLYKNVADIKNAKLVTIIFDIIGFGDELASTPTISDNFDFLYNAGVLKLTSSLPSDNYSFGFKDTVLIVALPREDFMRVSNNNTISLVAVPTFYDSFHNRRLDNKLSIINFDLVEKLYSIVHSAYCIPLL